MPVNFIIKKPKNSSTNTFARKGDSKEIFPGKPGCERAEEGELKDIFWATTPKYKKVEEMAIIKNSPGRLKLSHPAFLSGSGITRWVKPKNNEVTGFVVDEEDAIGEIQRRKGVLPYPWLFALKAGNKICPNQNFVWDINWHTSIKYKNDQRQNYDDSYMPNYMILYDICLIYLSYGSWIDNLGFTKIGFVKEIKTGKLHIRLRVPGLEDKDGYPVYLAETFLNIKRLERKSQFAEIIRENGYNINANQ